MRIGFLAGSSIPIHAKTLEERPLGGTETALIKVAEILTARGHDITVFTSHKNPPPSTPRYLPIQQIYNQQPFDLLVLVQDWNPALFAIPSKRLWFWTGDGAEQFSNFGLGDKRVERRIEKFLAVSNFHRTSLCEASDFPLRKTHVIGNGVDHSLFSGVEPRNYQRIIYTSAPYRGLSLVPGILLALREHHPSVEFHAFSDMKLYDRDAPYQGPHVDHLKKVAALLAKVPGCTLHGTIPQRALAREYMRSAIFFYPCTVPETCCITALEAQAAGCALVTSARGALEETVGEAGIIIHADPASEEFRKGCVAALRKLLDDPAHELIDRYGAQGVHQVSARHSWGNVVDRFEKLL